MMITHSSLECFKQCRRKYKLRYIDEIVTKTKSNALEFGSAMHRVLEEYFRRMAVIKADCHAEFYAKTVLKDYIEEFINKLSVDQAYNLEDEDWQKLFALSSGYITKWMKEDLQFELYGCEVEFENPFLIEGASFSGKIDAVVQNTIDGRYYIIEHKTASIVDDAYISQKVIDSQTLSYALGVKQTLGIQVSGVIDDIITKPKIRQKKGESKEEFYNRIYNDVNDDNFNRIVIPIEQEDLEAFDNELRRACFDLLTSFNEGGDAFYKCTGSCIGRYGACEYLPLCKSKGKCEDYNELYENRVAHEELSDVMRGTN